MFILTDGDVPPNPPNPDSNSGSGFGLSPSPTDPDGLENASSFHFSVFSGFLRMILMLFPK